MTSLDPVCPGSVGSSGVLSVAMGGHHYEPNCRTKKLRQTFGSSPTAAGSRTRPRKGPTVCSHRTAGRSLSDAAMAGRSYHQIAWVVVLGAIGLLLLHAWLLRRGMGNAAISESRGGGG